MKVKRNNLEKLIALIAEISNQPENEWFKNELIKKLNIDGTDNNSSTINEIYEYCIKLILRDHATKFYASFKFEDLKDNLVADFIRMEQFRRDDNFEDFCLAAFQQFEAIVNRLSSEPLFIEYIKVNKDLPAFLRYDSTSKTFVRKGNDKISSLIFQTNETVKLESFYKKPLNEWFFTQKYRAVLYYYYFDTSVKINSEFYDSLYNTGNFLYQGRNQNHRGSTPTQYQQSILDKLIPNKHKYYFKFLGFLEDFVSTVNSNIR
jgi:hypothetical protein